MVESSGGNTKNCISNVASSSGSSGRTADEVLVCGDDSGWEEVVDISNIKSLCEEQNSFDSSEKHLVCEANCQLMGGVQCFRMTCSLHASSQSDGEVRVIAPFSKENRLTCPLCEHVVASSFFRVADIVAKKFVRHLSIHDGELDSQMKTLCPSCYSFCKKSSFEEHVRQKHNDVLRTCMLKEVFYFTNVTRKYQDFVYTLASSSDMLNASSRIREDSVFSAPMKTDSEIPCAQSLSTTCIDVNGVDADSLGPPPSRNKTCGPAQATMVYVPSCESSCLLDLGCPDNVNMASVECCEASESHEPLLCGEHDVAGDGVSHPDEQGSDTFSSPSDTYPYECWTLSPSTSNEEEKQEAKFSSDSANGATKHCLGLEEHRANIFNKFKWDGPPPPTLNAVQIKQLACLSRNECPFCKSARGSRGLRVPHFANEEIKEESMVAHIVKFHHDDPLATWVLDAKRYQLSSWNSGNPLKFLLKPTKDGALRCSSCEVAVFDKLANLRVHWRRCMAVCGRYQKVLRDGRRVLESPAAIAKVKKRRSKNDAIKCLLPNCHTAWRPSFNYPNAVTQIAHVLSRHCGDKEAYETAVKLGDSERLAEEFPFLDVKTSFAKSVGNKDTPCLQCAKCDRGFQSPYELVQHAKRYHPTEDHYSGAPKCPFKCTKRLQRLKRNVSDNVLLLLHVMVLHLPAVEAVVWIEKWMNKCGSVMENEILFKFDVKESLSASLKSGSCQIKCFWCSTLIEGTKYFAHRRQGSACFGLTPLVSEKARVLIERDKPRSTRVRSRLTPVDNALRTVGRHKCNVCKLCSKNIIASDKYSERVSTFLHLLRIHLSDENAQEVMSEYSKSCAEEFPYVDVDSSIKVSISQGKLSLHCVICGFRTDTSRRLSMHARHHQELMRDLGNYPDLCPCGDPIRVCDEAKESFQRLCHILAKHITEEQRVVEAVSAYEADHASESTILDANQSVKLSQSNGVTFACSRCNFSSSNSYTLIHHSKFHQRNVSKDRQEFKLEKEDRHQRTESPVVCTICNRLLSRSSQYSAPVSFLVHLVKFHRNSPEDVETYLASGSLDVSHEFPYIDAITSIKKGKLQCGVCEAAFTDMSPLLKHATTVHENYQPEVSRQCTKHGAAKLLLPCGPFEGSSAHSRWNDTSESNDLERDINIAQYLVGHDGPPATSSRSSTTSAPAIDRLPQPSAVEASNGLSVDSSPLVSRRRKFFGDRGSLSISSHHSSGNLGGVLDCGQGPKDQQEEELEHQGSVINRMNRRLKDVSTTRRYFMLRRRRQHRNKLLPHTEKSLKDVLHECVHSGSSLKVKHDGAFPKVGTLFDELPGRVVQELVPIRSAPTDISHIEGAKGFLCNFCTFKGRTVNDIRRHTNLAHSECFPSINARILSPCHHCSQVLESRSQLLKHISDCHNDIPLAYKCAYCPKTFATARGAREHERRSHESRIFLSVEHLVCPDCGRQFHSKRNRDEHLKRHSNPSSTVGRGF